MSNINKAAKILFDSRINLKRLSKLPGDCAPKTSDEGYKIQNK